MKTIIEKYGIKNIWHFTDKANLDSIRQHGGLLSLKILDDRGIEIPAPGGNQWSHDADKSKGLDNFVHLAFVKNHPMLYTAQQGILGTDPIIDDVSFSENRVRPYLSLPSLFIPSVLSIWRHYADSPGFELDSPLENPLSELNSDN